MTNDFDESCQPSLSPLTKKVAPSNNFSRVIRSRLRIILSLVIVIATLLWFGMLQLTKTGYLHTLNSRHLHYTVKLQSQLHASATLNNILPDIRETIKNVRQQPLDCLSAIDRLDLFILSLIGTEQAVTVCQQDIEVANLALELIAKYEAGQVEPSTLLDSLHETSKVFSAHSYEFMSLIVKTNQATTSMAKNITVLFGLALVLGVVGISRSIAKTARELQSTNQDLYKSEMQCSKLAYYDDLTELPNRTFFRETFARSIAQASQTQQRIALLFVDLDRFKDINDTLGHQVGDQLLQQTADRLRKVVNSQVTLSRLSGDEFNLLLTDKTQDRTYIDEVAQKILSALSQPYHLQHAEVFVSASIGIVYYPDDGQTVDTLFRNADIAMYNAKENGRNQYCFFTSNMSIRLQRRFTLENELRTALSQQQLTLHYQPVVSLIDLSVVSAEALARWPLPDGSYVPPSKFIPVAEDTGLIIPLGWWVLEQACKQVAIWRRNGNQDFSVAVNVSARQLKDKMFASKLMDLLTTHHLPTQAINIELTESLTVVEDPDIRTSVNELGKLGFTLLLDDFGTGYSSFSYLESLPFNILKIDRSFIANAQTQKGRHKVALSIIAMAHKLGLQVIAEGIESHQALAHLSAHGCNYAQGYYLDKPMPAENFDCHRNYQYLMSDTTTG